MPRPSLDKITTKGKALFLAYDHGLEHGPEELEQFNGQATDPSYVLQIATKGGYNGVILQEGIAEKYYPVKAQKIPLIVKLNGKTELTQGDPVSRQICSVKRASELGAKAVGYTLYPGSRHETVMFAEFGRILAQAHKLGLPVLAWVYPRGEKIKNENSDRTVVYAARIALELGADVVKLKYCSPQGFRQAVEAAGRTKVMLAGGPKTKEKDFLKTVEMVIKTGAMGVVAGRNVWQSKNPFVITEKLKEIIFRQ